MKTRYAIKATCFDKKGRVISSAENSYEKTHPIQAMYAKKVGHPLRHCLHAEIAAIIRAKGKPIHSIFIERYGKKGEPRDAMPCPVCQLAIKEAKIEIISYTVGE